MAKLRSVIGSGFVGRIGNVVGVRGKGGEYVIRARAEEVKNPNTLRQRVSRQRMTVASQMAAGLASAIQAGYGKAAGNTKMYPRNMFVRNLVKCTPTTPLHVEGGIAEIQYADIKLSQRYGISTTPNVSAVSFDTAGKVTFTVQPTAVVDNLPEGKMGLVIVIYEPDGQSCVVKMVNAPIDAAATVDMNYPSSMSGLTVHCYSFFKWIPESANDVLTDTEPWKYPAETGDSAYCGSGNLG